MGHNLSDVCKYLYKAKKLYTCNTLEWLKKKKFGEEETTVAMKARSASLMQNQKFCCPVFFFLLFLECLFPFFHISLCECFRQVV